MIMQLGSEGVKVTTAATTARVAIPNDASGVRAKKVRVLGTGYIRPGDSSVNATNQSTLILNAESLILNVTGQTHIAYIWVVDAQSISITPVEN